MRTVKASEFKAKCLKIMDDVADSGEAVVVTKNGRPVSRVEPYRPPLKTLFGAFAGAIDVTGDLVEPVGAAWEAER